jgi:hypothetical protein
VEVTSGPRGRQRAGLAPSSPVYPLSGDASTFVGDVTIADGSVMPPLTSFQKTWRVRNSGTVPWVGRRLAREGAAAGLGIPSSPAFSPIPDTPPGQLVDITVPLVASRIDCTAQIRWKMVDRDGRQFFPDRYWYGLMLIIVVREGVPRFAQQPLLEPLPLAPPLIP